MIFYFSGTGNSLWVAQGLEKAFGGICVSMSEALKKEEFTYTLHKEESIFLVYPVHSWGPAVLVREFIDRLQLSGYDQHPVYSVCTCGDECGYTRDLLKKWLDRKGITLTESYSIEMPNNYILLPGFDVDSKEVETEKLRQAPERLSEVIRAIRANKECDLYKTGSMPFVKSRVIYPLFARFAIRKNSFYATENCISCGLCVKACPTGTISMAKGALPLWQKDSCVQCVACIHSCPERAIEYGTISKKKGRYHHPGSPLFMP